MSTQAPSPEEAARSVKAYSLFRGSRDFYAAYAVLKEFMASPDSRAGRAPSPLQALATCAAMALELALKARIVLDGAEPYSDGRKGHDYAKLFGQLSSVVQEEVAAKLQPADGSPSTADMLVKALEEFKHTLTNWRYVPVQGEIAFHEGNMVAIIEVLYESIVRLRSDFWHYPGVIVDPDRPVPWHLWHLKPPDA